MIRSSASILSELSQRFLPSLLCCYPPQTFPSCTKKRHFPLFPDSQIKRAQNRKEKYEIFNCAPLLLAQIFARQKKRKGKGCGGNIHTKKKKKIGVRFLRGIKVYQECSGIISSPTSSNQSNSSSSKCSSDSNMKVLGKVQQLSQKSIQSTQSEGQKQSLEFPNIRGNFLFSNYALKMCHLYDHF